MSVYPRTNAAGQIAWRYDFQAGGKRVMSAEPHYKSEAKARSAEKARRKALAKGERAPRARSGKAFPEPMARPGLITLEQAAERWWDDEAQRLRSAPDLRRRIDTVKRIVGSDPKVIEAGIAGISTAVVIAAMQARLKEETLTRYGKPTGKRVSGPCANRDIIDTLRPLLNYAGVVFEDEVALRQINWKLAREAESEEIVCEFTDAEVEAWADALRAMAAKHKRCADPELVFLYLATGYGPRLGELHFLPGSFKLDAPGGPKLELGRYIGKGGVVRTSRKDGSTHTVPLLAWHAIVIGHLAQIAAEAGADSIWLERRGDELTPIRYGAMRYRLQAAAAKAGIDKHRLIHGMRHHAGSAINRAGGLALTQKLLGHKQITTSRRYAHTTDGDLTEKLEQMSRKSPAQSPAQPQGLSR